MIITNNIPKSLQEILPPCLGSMMKHVFNTVDRLARGQVGAESAGRLGYSIQTMPTHTIKVIGLPEMKLSEYATKTTFSHNFLKRGVEGIHYFWNEGGLSCEMLTATDSREVVKDCYEGPFKGSLLYKACGGDPCFSNENAADWLPSITQVASFAIGAFATAKIAQNLINGNTSKALLWSAVVVGCLALQ